MPLDPRRILYRDTHYMAINKLGGELVVRGKGAVDKLPLLDFLRQDFPGVRALHRLDFETSGVVLFALTKDAYERAMEAGFQTWEKTYRALVMGRMDRAKGSIRFPLPARVGDELVPAETHYQVLQKFVSSTYVECVITTGRHHQIRRHFEMIKHPLVLDQVYGHKKFNGTFTQEFKFRRFFLHAYSLAFLHPFTKETVTVTAPMPKPFEDVLKALAPYAVR